MRTIEITASSYEEAVKNALKELGVSEDKKDSVSITVLKESGLIRKKVTISATLTESIGKKAENFIIGLLSILSLNVELSVTETDTNVNISLKGDDTDKLIGYRGEIIDALQYLTLLVANKNSELNKKITLNGANYREKREATLTRLAKNLAFKAAKAGRPMSLEPMNPFERRIIHSALHDDTFVTTASEGEEPNRYVVIIPNRIRSDKPFQNKENHVYNNRNSDRGEHTSDRGYEKKRFDKPRAPFVPNGSSNITELPAEDMYDNDANRNFSKKGLSKTRSFGKPGKKSFF